MGTFECVLFVRKFSRRGGSRGGSTNCRIQLTFSTPEGSRRGLSLSAATVRDRAGKCGVHGGQKSSRVGPNWLASC
eukprot:110470-Pyramimonas_sp.AAC.1